MGLVPIRGPWRYRLLNTTSAATFRQGSAVKIGTARTLSEYSGGEASLLGVAMHNSADSLPAGKVLVAIPGNGCYALADVPTGIGASSLSIGQAYGLYKSGNTISYITTSYTSAAGKVVVITGELNSANSTIEVQFLSDAIVFNSTTSQTIA